MTGANINKQNLVDGSICAIIIMFTVWAEWMIVRV
ncbi:hypothetical protein SAMN04488587_0671 [Methanococcoides vulcani]|uniref:Uncharacterized protein n=1 Tax=Methanococcoides vulcani TaxID=1353158 RepID=A0A1H9YLY4_9EURY|nr:hypothetical protein SAMN04488587_0671 [Methanococcoides vulcani]